MQTHLIPICHYQHCNCILERKLRTKQKSKSKEDSWRRSEEDRIEQQQQQQQQKSNKTSSSSSSSSSSFFVSYDHAYQFLEKSNTFFGCQSSPGFAHMHHIASCIVYGYSTFHECTRRFLYSENYLLRGLSHSSSSFSGSSENNNSGSDNFPLQQLASWSADKGIFIHPDLEFHRFASDYRDYQLAAKNDTVLPYLTPLIVVPAQCLIGFADAEDEVEKKDMLKGTAIAAGVAIENDMSSSSPSSSSKNSAATAAAASTSSSSDNKQEQQEEEKTNTSSGGVEDVCKFFFDSLSLLTNDCLVADNNSTSDIRHIFSSILLSGTRTLKNAPYLSDRDFALVGASCPIAEAFRRMIHNFVDNGPLSGKVERQLLQSAVSLSLSHSIVLPMNVRRPTDHLGELLRGVCDWNASSSSSSSNKNNKKKSALEIEKVEDFLPVNINTVIGGEKIETSSSSSTTNAENSSSTTSGSIGIIPWLHMLPHGGSKLNAVTIAVSAENASSVAAWMALQVPECGFTSLASQRVLKNGFVALVVCEDIGPSEEVCTQTMAPLNPVKISPNSLLSTQEEQKNKDSAAAASSSSEKNKKAKTKEQQEKEREILLQQQFELDKEYDETLAMWMVTTASAPSLEEDDEGEGVVASSEAQFIQSCVSDAVMSEVEKLKQEFSRRVQSQRSQSTSPKKK